MQFCKICKVQVHGFKKCCPLCQGELTGEGEPFESYPYIEKVVKKSIFMKLIIFITALAIIVPLFINLAFPTNVFWAYFVVAGVLCVWVTVYVGIVYRKKICHNITIELFLISILSFIWDVATGFNDWSLTYVLPICTIISLISIYVLSQVLKQVSNEHVIYLGLNALWGLLPLSLIVFKKINVIYPSAVCSGLSIVFLCIIFVFYGKSVFDEIKRKLHM